MRKYVANVCAETLTGEILCGVAPLHRLKLVCKVSFDEPLITSPHVQNRRSAASRRLTVAESQEILMPSLHLLQISLVYVNTLTIQRVFAEPEWQNRLTAVDLSPLRWRHAIHTEHLP